MPAVLIALILLSLSPAAFADTVCHDPTGQLRYNYVARNKGTPPVKGELLGTIEISYRGMLQSESKAYEGKEAELGPINPDFSEQIVLKKETGANGPLKIFSAMLVLSKNANTRASEEPMLQLPQTVYVICQESFLAVP